MLDIDNLKPGQMVRYSSKGCVQYESLWILLEEVSSSFPTIGRAFKLYQIYDSEGSFDNHESVTYIFNSSNTHQFTLEVA